MSFSTSPCEQPEAHEAARDDVDAERVDRVERRARARGRDRLELRLQDQLVDGLLLAGKRAPDRERPRDVARVVAVLAPGIDEEEIARRRCGGRSSGSGARRRSGPSRRCSRRRAAPSRGGGTCRGGGPRPRTRACPGASGAMAPLVRLARDARGGAHRLDLVGATCGGASRGGSRPGRRSRSARETPVRWRGRARGRWRPRRRSSKRAVVARGGSRRAGGSGGGRQLARRARR